MNNPQADTAANMSAKLDRILEVQEDHSEALEGVVRTLRGSNGDPGVVGRQFLTDERVDNLRTKQNGMIWFLALVVLAVITTGLGYIVL